MALQNYQVQIRDLVMSISGRDTAPVTNFTVLDDFNPFEAQNRADQSGSRAWGHGSWSGAEWREEVVVPMRIYYTDRDARTPERWLELHQQLAAVFRPVGDNLEDVELRFKLGEGSREYVMFGRPRMVNPDTKTIRAGWSVAQAAFVALDPLIYDGVETVHTGIGAPAFTGGLTIPAGGAALNSNTSFETDTSGWFVNGGTKTHATDESYQGSGSLLAEPDGVASTVEAGSADVAVVEGDRYRWSMWVLSPDGYDSVRLRLVWRDDQGADLSSDFSDTVSVPAGEWTPLELDAVAVAGAAEASPRVQILNSPTTSDVLYVDEARLRPAGGGLTAPFTIDASMVDGFADLTNNGTADAGLVLRINGPVSEPTIVVQRDDGTHQKLSVLFDVAAGQWVDIDTSKRTVLLNGEASRRGRVTGQFPLLPSGTHRLRWLTGGENDTGSLDAQFRGAYW